MTLGKAYMDVDVTESPESSVVKRLAVEFSKLIHGSEDGHGAHWRIRQSSRGYAIAIAGSMLGIFRMTTAAAAAE